MTDAHSTTLVHRFLHWEQSQPDAVYLTQPRPDGTAVDYSWKEVGNQARRMASYLRSLALPDFFERIDRHEVGGAVVERRGEGHRLGNLRDDDRAFAILAADHPIRTDGNDG